MASLRNIINEEEDTSRAYDERRTRGSVPNPMQAPGQPPSIMSFIGGASGLSHMPSSAHDPGRSTSMYPLPPLSADSQASSAPSASGRSIDGRRRSNNSSDSTDSPYGQSYLSGTTSGVSSDRRDADMPLRLTPVTGRVSRAKKGVPVHVCEQCQPPKRFTRAEHLRRHQLSHQPPDLTCKVPGCNKRFHRKDLLERHLQKHEQDREASRSGGDLSTDPYAAVASPGVPHGHSAGYPQPRYSVGSSDVSGSLDPSGGRSHRSHAQPALSRQLPGSSREPGSSYMWEGMSQDHAGVLGMASGGNASATADLDVFPSVLSDMHHGISPATSQAWSDQSTSRDPSERSSSYPGPLDMTARMDVSASNEWHSLPNETTLSLGLPTSAPYSVSLTGSTSHHPPTYMDSMGLAIGHDEPSYFGSDHLSHPTVGNLNPKLVATQSETLVTMPSAIPPDRIVDPLVSVRPSLAGLGMPAGPDALPAYLNRVAQAAMPGYIDVYWEKAHPSHPVIHKAALVKGCEVVNEPFEVLQCAMAAVGSQFLAGKEHRIRGHQLHFYACQKLRRYTQSDFWPLPIMQAVLVCEYYSRFRGRKREAHQPSTAFTALYQMLIAQQPNTLPITMKQDQAQDWVLWVDVESRRRLLAACFVLDVHSTRYFEQPSAEIAGLDYSMPHGLPIPLSESTMQAWEASNSQSWSRAMLSSDGAKTTNSNHLANLTAEDIAAAPPFDMSVLLAVHTLLLPKHQNISLADLLPDIPDVTISNFRIVQLFPDSLAANTYLALQYTPLQMLLAVSGDGWVFNKKILQAGSFINYQEQFQRWCESGSAAVAVIFAARTLCRSIFAGAKQGTVDVEDANRHSWNTSWTDLSDWWGVYVCTLICWAFGHRDKLRARGTAASRTEAARWIQLLAMTETAQAHPLADSSTSRAVVGMTREVLESDCIGGRNILFADAIEVLKKLEERDGWA